MGITSSEMESFQEGKTPNNGRQLEGGKQTYASQLNFNVDAVIDNLLTLNKTDINILDLGGFKSVATQELKGKLLEKNPDLNITLNTIDLQNIDNIGDNVNFLQGDLEDENFMNNILETLGTESQDLIFMNQVSYYMGDRLKVIKFILENILSENGKFLFNLLPKRFYVGAGFHPSQFVDELEKLWNNSKCFSYGVSNNTNNPESRVYDFTKLQEGGEIKMPGFRRSIRDINGYCDSIYNLREEMNLKIENIL